MAAYICVEALRDAKTYKKLNLTIKSHLHPQVGSYIETWCGLFDKTDHGHFFANRAAYFFTREDLG